jgi:hypothetical protein
VSDTIKKSSTDITYSETVNPPAILSIGSTAISEILTMIITPSLQARREEWMSEIGQILKELEEANKVQLESLTTNQQFIDTVLQATNYALKTSDKEKISIFKNVIINSALGDTPEQTISHIFLTLIDSFTTWHIKILKLFDNPTAWFRANNKTLPNYMAASLSTVVIEAFPILKGQNELLDLIWSDLNRAGLHNTSDLRTTMSGNGLLAERTTNLGKQFLRYISEN